MAGKGLGKRKLGGRSTAGAGKRKYRKTMLTRSARIVNLNKDVHYFKRMVSTPGSFSGNVAYAPLLQAWSFNFNQLANAGEFTALFDQYKITHIQCKFFLKIDPGAQSAAGASYPKLYWCADHDDDSAAPSLNAMREHSKTKVRVLHPNRPVVCNIKPAILAMTYKTATTTGYCPMWKKWVDCNDSTVPHYGLKWAIDDLTNTNYKVDTEVTYWFQTRAAR